MKKNFHVVPHSHWDREWYFTTSRSKVYLMKDLKDVLDTLESNPRFSHFVLDGQASLLVDYLNWRPQDEDRIRQLVEAGKLVIGPWYTQTDQMVISGESIVRNLYYGIHLCTRLGNYMNIGYVPDSFGQAASMPQIYRGFGIHDTLFWRGVSDDEVTDTEFKWIGEDGSVVNAFQMPAGYYIGGNLPENEADLKKLLTQEPFQTIINRSSTSQVYFPNGFDQAPIRKNLPELLNKMKALYPDCEFKISTVELYIQAVKADKKDWQSISGELLNGKLMRIHKSIFSSRPDLKAMNTRVQNYLVNIMEPVLSMAYMLDLEYPVRAVAEIWKLMFENAAHDSIGSCVSDTTNEDVYLRYKQAGDISANLVELALREMATRIKKPAATELTFTLFNTLDQPRSEVVEAEVWLPGKHFGLKDSRGNEVPYTLLSLADLTDYVTAQTIRLNPSQQIYRPETVYKARIALLVKDLPAMGYERLTVDLGGDNYLPFAAAAENHVENNNYLITVNENGALDILDKKNNHLYRNQAVLEENGDDGDSFNYSPPRHDLVVRSTASEFDYQVQKSDLFQTITLTYQMMVPADLAERAQEKAAVKLAVELVVKIKADDPVIDFTVNINNNVRSHRLCVLFDTGLASQTSIADLQFGVIRRPVYLEQEMKLWAANPGDWNELPVSIETCQSFVSLSGQHRGVVVFPKGVREYEIIGTDYSTIRLTLLRTYGTMGKADLLYRPGRASGETAVETPDAQLLKPLSFDFSACYYQSSFDESGTARLAKRANSPVLLYQDADFLNGRMTFSLPEHERVLEPSFSLLENRGNLILSTLKKAENRDGLIIRYYNGSVNRTESLKLVLNPHYLNHSYRVDLNEEPEDDSPAGQSPVILNEVKHARFVSLYLEK